MYKNRLSLIAITTFVLLSNQLSAQEYSKGRETSSATINLTEIANYEKLHPKPLVIKIPMNEDEMEEHRNNRRGSASQVHLIDRDGRTAEGPSHTALLPASPAPNDSFLSTLSPGVYIPPDTHGAVDSEYCVTAINSDIHVQTRAGGNVTDVTLDGFWHSVLPAGTDAFDPRVHYDPFNKRWILVTDAVNGTTYANSTLMIGVSVTNDPTGAWNLFTVAIDATGATWLDFPNVGFNKQWITVTGNIFTSAGSSSGATVLVFNYASIMAGTGAPYTRIPQTASFAIAPAITYDTTQMSMFAIESWKGSAGQLRLWKISGPVGSPVMTSIGYPTTTQHWKGSYPGGASGFTPQVGTTNKMDAGDDRITSVMYRNHKLWTCHTIFLPATGTVTRCSVQWWQIDTLANPIQQGAIDDPTGVTFYDYSSIAANVNDDALVGFGYFSAAIHPSCAYSLHLHTDPLDSIRPPHVFRNGVSTYYTTFGGSKNRWGDYSGTCVDPRNDTDFWTIQESCTTGSTANWDTWWANVQFCPKPNAPTMATMPSAICAGDTGTYTINTIAGATAYVWNVSGTGWSGTSTGTSITVTAGSGAGYISVLAYNSCGEGETQIFTVTPNPLPSRPSITTVTPACVGSSTAVFSATSSFTSGYSWLAGGAGWSGSSTSTSLTANVGSGTGMIICTASNACGSVSDTINVTPLVVPVTSFTIAHHVEQALVGDVITFTGSAPSGSVYTWNFGGGTGVPGTGAGPQTVTWTTTGLMTVTLTIDNGGCTSTYSDTVLVTRNVGVQNVNNPGDGVNILPNPNEGTFEIVMDNQPNKEITVKLLDMQGRIVYSNSFAPGNTHLPVSTANLPAGVYTVTISTDGSEVTKKVTIVK